MSAVATGSDSSQSSSGYEDGLGRRVIAFDRESGVMLERLILRPELCAFEKALSDRLNMLASLDDERFAKPRTIEHLVNGSLIVISEFAGGRRLSDIVDAAAEHGIVAGLDAGLGLLLELLPAVARLHDAGLTHGALAAGRIMVTPDGQILLLDALYAEPLEKLQLTRKRLWSELRLAFPPTAGLARFDKTSDLSAAVMVAASLVVGRPLRDDEYPEGIAALRQEIREIASIRGTNGFADGVDQFFAVTLPLQGRKAGVSADEAATDLRKVVRKELGINTCRSALTEFLQQVESADAERLAAETSPKDARKKQEAERAAQAGAETQRQTKARAEAERVAREKAETERAAREDAERRAREEAEREEREEDERRAREDAKRRARDEADRKAREEADRKARDEADRRAREEAERKAREEAERKARDEAERKARDEAERKAREEAERKARAEAERKAREEAERKKREEAELKARVEARAAAERKAREEAERKAREEAERKKREEAERKARAEAERKAREEAERKARAEAERKAREEAQRREQERLEAERVAREKAEADKRERERIERERLAREARERAEQARLEAERLEAERIELERAERERLAQIARERAERERIEAERLEREARQRAEEEAQERAAAEARERAAQEARERAERERLEREARQRAEEEARERAAAEARARAERERLERDRLARERLIREEQERNERLEKERQEKERLERERVEKDRVEKERLEKERLEKDRLEQERIAAEALAAEHAARAKDASPAGSGGGWLVNPKHASVFQPPADSAAPPTPPAPPAAAKPYPIYVSPSEPAAWTPNAPAAPAPHVEIIAGATSPNLGDAATPLPAPSIKLKETGPIKLKDAASTNYDISVRGESRSEPVERTSYFEAYSPEEQKPARSIPWKMIAAGVVLLVGAFAVIHYLPSSAAPAAPVAKATPPPEEKPPVISPTTPGDIDVKTDPAALKVLLDGKPVGESPMTLRNVSVGRHVITLIGVGGTLKRTVKVEPGATASVEVTVFSGFVKISAPFVIEIAENGKVIGTSDDAVILGPGRHKLNVSNKDLEYDSTEEVEVQPGETTQLTLDPRGAVNLNAVPWAEVWVDGDKIGETPVANAAIRLGVREIVFKNPQFPDRKVVTTIKAKTSDTISVDFSKDK